MIKWLSDLFFPVLHWREGGYSEYDLVKVRRKAEADAREFVFTILFALIVGVASLLFTLAGRHP